MGTKFSEIVAKKETFMKMHSEMSSEKCWPFCRLNVLKPTLGTRGSLPASSAVTFVRVATIYAYASVATRTVRTRTAICTNEV